MSTPSPLEVIFFCALEKQLPEERTSYLEQACADDHELRERVDKMLAAQVEAGSFLEVPAQWTASGNGQSFAEQPGEVIGPYKLLEQIGEGGMGTVYLAEQTEPVARQVALKIIKPGMDSRQVIARFEAERQALAVMDHPNIAKVVDAGTTESGRPYFVMELVKGVPITQYCDAHKLSVRERLELFVPVCQAIQHAHQKGIIHRDIKPSNVMVACYDGRPVPKVIDFGIAKATEQRLTERTAFTQFGQIVGTFEYMSPEQSQLNQLDIDTRSDVYSLGVLLYELLTGQTPFDGERLRSAAFDDVLRIIREEDPPRPSSRISTSDTLPEAAANRHIEPKRLSALVRGELDWIVMKALEKDRARRYATATALGADVEHYLNDEPVDACPPSSIYRIGKFTRRNKGWLSTAAVVLLTVLVGLTLSTVLIARERDAAEASARREAVAALQAEQRLDDARYNLYVAQTRLAREDWNDGQVNRMVASLETHIPQQGGRDLRGWEWFYLMSLPRHDLATLRPDIGEIINVKWCCDRRYLATAGQIIVVYDALTKKPKFQIPEAKHFAWSPKSHELAVTRYDGKVSVWDADLGKDVRQIGDANGVFTSAWDTTIWSRDGSRIAVGAGLRLHVWPADGSGEANTFAIDKRLHVALCLDWSPDGRHISIGANTPVGLKWSTWPSSRL
ncbi:MAG: WD40 repeat domain-containing serine/threonine protein kinase [Pirellulales bacterium]